MQSFRYLNWLLPIAFCLGGPAAAAPAGPTGEIFRASFEHGFAADLARGAAEPAQTARLQTVPGVRGNGVFIPADGALEYDLAGNLRAEAGALSMWVKPRWSVEGTGTWLDRPAAGEAFYKTSRCYFSAGPRHQASQNVWLNYLPGKEYAAVKQIFAGTWFHLVFVWDDAANESVFYLNGMFGDISGGLGRELDAKLKFGSVSDLCYGLDGVLDEVRIYDRALDAADAQALYADVFPLATAPLDFAGAAGTPGNYRVRLVNLSDKTQEAEYAFKISAVASGQICAVARMAVALPAGATRILHLPFTPPAAGGYRIAAEVGGRTQRIWEIAAIAPENQTGQMPLADAGSLRTSLIRSIDCAREPAAEEYADDGACRVVASPCGRYRTTALRRTNAGFAYRFDIPNPGGAYWIEIDYPDDADRIFSLVIYPRAVYPAAPTCDRYLPGGSLDTIGIMTGGARPVSTTRQTKRLLLWPDSREIMVGCFAYIHPDIAGPAAMELRLYENNGPLPRLPVNPPAGLPARVLGAWEEDPSMAGANWFNRPECYRQSDFDFWLIKAARMAAYARHCGRNQWSMLLLDYHGDNSGALNYILPASRNTAAYGRIPGWADAVAAVFEREQMPFLVELNQRNNLAGRLDRKEWGALAHIIGRRKLSRDFAEAEGRGEAALEQFTAGNALARMRNGEDAWALDPLHPEVQAGYLRLVRAYRDKFGKYAQFAGINMISPVQLDYAGPESGYGDYTVNRFARETGAALPSAAGPERFAERCRWLQANAWERWLDWRCAGIAAFYAQMLAELNIGSSGKRLVIRLVPGRDNPIAAALAGGKPPPVTLAEFWRERGIDLALLGRVAGLQVLTELRPNYSEVHPENGDERYYTFSPAAADFARQAAPPGVLLHQHANLEVYWSIARSPIRKFWRPVGVCTCNDLAMSHYATPQPVNRYVLENLAWILAETDAHYIDHGFWGCPENGALEVYQPFHQAYLSLPQLRFDRHGHNDPAVLRVHDSPAGHWFYVVNKAEYPVRIKLALNPENERIVDAALNREIVLRAAAGRAWLERELAGYGVLAGRCPAPLQVLAWEQTPPVTARAELAARLAQATAQLDLYAKIFGVQPNDAAALLEQAQAAAAEGRLTQADYLIQSRAIRRLARDLACNLRAALIPDGRLRLEFCNVSAADVSGRIKLLEWPDKYGWQPASREQSFAQLPAGETLLAEFPFAAAAFHHRAQHDFTVELTVGDGLPAVQHLQFFPHLALRSGTMPEMDGCLDDWTTETVWHDFDGNGASRWACRWNEDGLALAVSAAGQDSMPGAPASHSENGGLQVRFNQRGGRVNAGGDAGPAYLIARADGVVRVWRGLAPAGPGAAAAAATAAVRRENCLINYEVFFPAAEFKPMRLEPGLNLDCCLMIHAAGRAAQSQHALLDAVATNTAGCPWRDLILVQTVPSRAEVSVSGAGMTPGAVNAGAWHFPETPENNAAEQYARNLTYNSNLLGGEWRAYSFEFIPRADGKVRLALTGEWAPDGYPTPLVKYRSVQVSGAAAPAPELRQWQNCNAPAIRDEDGVTVVRVSRKQPLFIDLETGPGRKVRVSFEACRSGTDDSFLADHSACPAVFLSQAGE